MELPAPYTHKWIDINGNQEDHLYHNNIFFYVFVSQPTPDNFGESILRFTLSYGKRVMWIREKHTEKFRTRLMLNICIIALNFDQILASFDLLRNILFFLFQGFTYAAET